MPLDPRTGLEMPTKEAQIVTASPETIVTLWRGTTVEIKDAVLSNRSAGGSAREHGTGAPSEDAVRGYVGGFSGSAQLNAAKDTVTEYTSDTRVAMQFARGALLIVKIKRKYLTKGSEL